MANAFTIAMSALLADANMAQDAIFYAGGAGPGVALRVLRQTATEPVMMGGGLGSMRAQQIAIIATAELPDAPGPNDAIVIGTDRFRIESAETDDQRVSWRVTLSE